MTINSGGTDETLSAYFSDEGDRAVVTDVWLTDQFA